MVLLAIAVAGFAGVQAPEPRKPSTSASAAEPTPVPGPSVLVDTPVPLAITPAAPTSTPVPLSTTLPSRTSAGDTVSMPPPLSATPTPEPGLATVEQRVIGHSVEGRPIIAHRAGTGPVKIVLVGNIHGAFEANTHVLAQQLADYYGSRADEVPASISLWIIPTMNPDGLATGHRWNAHDVDLNRNADTDLDGCAGNDWSPDTVGLEGTHPGAGGAYPFSEPESQAVRDFLQDAWLVVFYHSAAEAIYIDACQQHLPTARLAEVLSEASGYPVPAQGWSGYPITGDWGDYLAGEGVAALTVELTDHQHSEFVRNLAGVEAMLAHATEILSSETTAVGAESLWLDASNIVTWQYADHSFLHPIALEVVDETAYLLDGGRVLALDLTQAQPPRLLLAPGDYVDHVRTLEVLDLASDGSSILALDRAGDVYRYDTLASMWSLERYDRPASDGPDRYYVALAAGGQGRYLLETTHEQIWRFTNSEKGLPWAGLVQGRDVDLAVSPSRPDRVYALSRGLANPAGQLASYSSAGRDGAFDPNIRIMHPRQTFATDSSVFVLDRAGRRLLRLNAQSGRLITLLQFTDRRAVSVAWASPDGDRLLLAGRDTLYLYGAPSPGGTGAFDRFVEAGPLLQSPQPHDLSLMDSLGGLLMPIAGATVTSREFQMPGAPRHYRLGVHEGLDFYSHTAGVTVDRTTTVRAVADGTIVRAMVDYQGLTAVQADAWSTTSRSLGYTPDDILDGYRGRQVWIDHGSGIVSRYAHLGSIASDIVEGATVRRGQEIASVGNSGTPSSVTSDSVEVHLHFELWVGDHFAGQFLRPIEARELLERILR
jgi:murein DD-endopeptidase MepM/ murein hydrolase activator NlpD